MSYRNEIFCLLSVSLLILIQYPTDVAAISCFQCNSKYNESCANILPNDITSSYYRQCEDDDRSIKIRNGRDFFCRKIVQNIGDKDDKKRVVRTCGYVTDPKNRTCFNHNTEGHKAIMCQCFTDSCNSASVTFMSPILALAAAVLATKWHILT